MLKKQFKNINPSSTLLINEISNQLEEEGKEVFRFGLGQSPFPIPEELVTALKENAYQKNYLNVSGLLELRKAVAKYHKKKNKYLYNENCIIIGPGSKELIFQSQMVLDMPLILPKPSWVSYEPQAKFINKKVHWIETSKKTKWHLSACQLLKHCKKFKYNHQLLILNSPNNPTGTNNDELKEISKICKDYGIIVISDEIYAELDFAGKYQSISHFYPESTIVSSGLSKWCGAGGWRIGTLIFPDELKRMYESVRSLSSETFSSVSAPIQFASVKAYKCNHQKYLKYSRKILRIVANYVYSELTLIGIDCVKPQGGFYILCDFTKLIKNKIEINNATDLCKEILNDTGFAMLPGKNFGFNDNKLITRLAYVDFDGKAALQYFYKLENNKFDINDFKILFPKIIRGIETLKDWVKKNLN